MAIFHYMIDMLLNLNAILEWLKKILGPVHLHPKTDKWDYLQSPIMKKIFVCCFDIGEVLRGPGKWNWNWLYFLPFIFTFEQGEVDRANNYTIEGQIFHVESYNVLLFWWVKIQNACFL